MGDSTPMALRSEIAVALLGEIAVRRDGVLTAVPGVRARLLVAALATHPGRSRGAQALIDEVWGEDPPRAPMNALHTQVSRLRSALPDGALEIGPAGYRLILAPDQVDLTLAQRLEGQARQAHTAGDHRTCLDLLSTARGLWRGEPAADLPPGPVAEELATLAATRRRALDTLELSAREAIGDLPAAIELAQQAVAADPFDEPAHGTLMRLLAAAGRTTEALDVFATLRTRLVDQLGADPGPALVALNTAILRGEPQVRNQPPGPHGSGEGGLSAVPGGGERPGSGDGGSTPGGQVTSIDGHHWAAPGAGGAHHDSHEVRSLGRMATSAHVGSARTAEARELVGETAIGLRAAPNPLLGREADLAALEALLRSARVVTVLGPGGTGKTRIANELGARMAHETAVALVELASLRAEADNPADTRAEIEMAIATTLGVADIVWETSALRQAQKRDIRQKMREALGIRPTLLILDNCEHLIEPVAEVVADLIGVSDQLTVLTTSRAPLEIMAEAVYPLPPLTIDASGSPATDLFEARARAVRPSVRLDPQVVARLCRTLDGLPLAIELAAARVRTMSVEEIDSRLDHRFALLRSGDRSSPQRHRTLHAVIEWSWNLLDEPQRVALRRLCRFPAGFTLEAAEYLLSGPEIDDPALAVDGLVSQSMLTVLEGEDGGTRYRMLETVREFGEEQLAFAGEIDWVMARMSQWAKDFAVETARRYHTDEQLRAVLGLGADMDNLVAVLRHALERRDVATVHTVFPILAGLWVVRGAHAELISWSPRIIAVPPTTFPTVAAETDLYVQGQLLLGLHLMFGGPDTRDVARVRTTIRRILASGAPVSPVARYLGELATRPRNTTQLARMLSAGVRSSDEQIRLAALILRANLCENDGMVYRSIKDAEIAMRLSGDQDVWGTAMTTQHLGSMYGQSARYDEAVGYYRKAVELLEELRAFDEAVEMRSLLAITLAGMGNPAAARAALEPALAVVGELPADAPVTKPNHRIASVAAALAEIELAEGDIDTGLRRYRQVLPLMDWPHNVAMPGPATLIYASAVIDAHVLHDRVDQVRRTAVELTDVVVRVMGGQYWDLPQIGSMSCAIGTYLLATGQHVERGLELIALTPKVFGRQDYPSMQWRLHLDLHRAAVGEERVTTALNAVAGLGRRKAADRIMNHLKAIDGTL
ncbi:AfsR/SARP family transcriptional regulator [Nocardia sp. CDC160]|uniref:AfsR/SARP family transcriptional regulator n=1 Tax=Nocardia sp. CDC160 TaxID=3112166 RepID=UPI002DBB6CD8|nr:BTAD domain-containing putative transcriptional regulator [Nocardia sp. CDC160]MEC3919558.1 BTAD domain-containing putative transcriptional regulator [Nocardia sp. CDC160]